MAKPIIHITAATHFPIKLTPQNFPSWRTQVTATLIGLELDHHIIGTDQTPAETIPDGENTKPNPDFLRWFRQDQMIISALLGSCSDQIQPIVSSAKTARKAWELLNSSYASRSRSRIISLKSRLAKNRRGNRSISDYLYEMKSLFDELAIAQSPMSEEDLVVHIMNQLGDDYSNLVASFRTRDTTISFADLFEKLLDHERTLKETITEPLLTTVNYTHRTNPRTNQNRQTNTYEQRPTRHPNPPTTRNQYSSRNNSNTTRPTRNNNAHCYYRNIPGHDTKDCRKLSRFLREHNVSPQNNNTPVVNYTTLHPSATTPSWMWDTGASNNTANNNQQFPVLSEYGGPDEIVLGDGSTHGGASHAGSERQ
ncbi:putative RNA-directed DNA polymerase [Helianthus annuus]|nr:putative RNA-directed DNA polymerase [Helianthus annuus]